MEDAFSDPANLNADDGAADALHRRRSPRDSLFLQATIWREDEEEGYPVRLRNLSSHGMMAEIDAPFATGDRIRIDLRGVGEIEGFIVWQVERRAGVAFSVPIDPRRARKAVPVRPAPVVAPALPVAPRLPRLFGK